MKIKYISLCALTLTFLGCGGSENSPCKESFLLGKWLSVDIPLEFKDSCHGAGGYCHTEFTYEPTTKPADGRTAIRILKTDVGPQCPPLGVNICDFQLPSTNTLRFNCGQGVSQYQKQ